MTAPKMFPKIHPANTLRLFWHVKALRILLAPFKSHHVPEVKHQLPWAPTPGGTGGTRPPRSESRRGTSPRNHGFYRFLKELTKIFRFFKIFKIKWPKSQEKSEFGGRWVWRMRIHPPPQSKPRGGATASCVCCVDSISADGTLDLDIFMNLEFSYMMQVL